MSDVAERYDVVFETKINGEDATVVASHTIDDANDVNSIDITKVLVNSVEIPVSTIEAETIAQLTEDYHRARLMQLGNDIFGDIDDDLQDYVSGRIDDLMSDIHQGFGIQPGI